MEYIIIAVALLLRCMVGLWGHSGEGVAPMYGDFEAQRHWLEVTSNLPVGDWYRDTVDNDLQYWGLDYPPLTAYVSLALGKLAELLYPNMVALHASRGIETAACTFFMRSSVLLLDAAIFFPAVFKLGNAVVGTHVHPKYLFLSLLSPALMLIDHGHFQYNSTCLGLALLATYLLDQDRYLLASVMFCLSLNFKQMALYYAPVFFFFLLGRCNDTRVLVSHWRALGLLVQLCVAVVGSFALLWAPFCAHAAVDDGETCLSSLAHVLSRQFPFSRGIFEDKVANLWFALSIAYRQASGGVDMREVSDTSTLSHAVATGADGCLSDEAGPAVGAAACHLPGHQRPGLLSGELPSAREVPAIGHGARGPAHRQARHPVRRLVSSAGAVHHAPSAGERPPRLARRRVHRRLPGSRQPTLRRRAATQGSR